MMTVVCDRSDALTSVATRGIAKTNINKPFVIERASWPPNHQGEAALRLASAIAVDLNKDDRRNVRVLIEKDNFKEKSPIDRLIISTICD